MSKPQERELPTRQWLGDITIHAEELRDLGDKLWIALEEYKTNHQCVPAGLFAGSSAEFPEDDAAGKDGRVKTRPARRYVICTKVGEWTSIDFQRRT